jgi:hypothetical protein
VSERAKDWAVHPKNAYTHDRFGDLALTKHGSTYKRAGLRIAAIIWLLFDASKMGFLVKHKGKVPYITMSY